MRQARIIRRANNVDRRAIREWDVLRIELFKQVNRSTEGKVRKMAVKRCPCKKLHWATKDSLLSPKQREVSKLCSFCFKEKYGKFRPYPFRMLTLDEIKKLENYYKASGCKIISPE